MPYYEVTLRNESGAATVNYDAPSAEVARMVAARDKRGWTPTAVKLLTERPDKVTKAKVREVKGKQLVRLCRSVGSMLNAKIGLEDSLNFYANGLEDVELRDALTSIRERLVSGASAAEAFASSGRFSEMFVGLVKAGSDSGSLGEAFRAIADRTHKTMEFRTKLKKALYTPVIVITGILHIFVAALTQQIPQIEKMMSEVGAKPDPFSAFVFAMSHFVKAVWPYVYCTTIIVILTLVFSQPLRERILGWILSRWRVARDMVMGIRQLMVLGTMGMIVRNGGSVLEALACAAKVVGGTPMATELGVVGTQYQHGFTLAEAVRRFTSCDKAVPHMIGAGERGGTLPEQLALLTDMYEEQTNDAMEVFVAVTGFLTLLISCALIGFVFLSSILPTVLMGPKMMQAMH